MQTLYVGNTLINDVMLGSTRMADVTNTPPKLVTTSLTYYFDASISSSAANWRSVIPYGNRTGSLFQTNYTSTYPQTFNLTGSVPDINFGSTPTELKNSPYTILMVVNQKNDVGRANLTWYGNSSGGSNVFLQASGSVGSSKFLRVATDNSSSVATNLSFTLNEYHQVAMTVTGSTFAGVSVWVDNNKQTFQGADTFTGNNGSFYWIIGTENSQNPLSGSVLAYCVYNRVLSDTEILTNYEYFRARLGFI